MTLPFRRRHHDDESAHDRARALTSREMIEPISESEESWLAGHLDVCAECRRDREAYLADRLLLRSLRDRSPEPPRDLWARTSAALDRESRSRSARGGGARSREGLGGGRGRAFPLGAAAGVLIMVVVIGASIVQPNLLPGQSPAGTKTAVLPSAGGQPTPFEIAAGHVGWVRPTSNGSWELVFSDVDAVCPRTLGGCQPLGEDVHGRPVNLGNAPTSMTISPNEDRLVVESLGAGDAPNRILVVPVPAETAVPTAEPNTTSPATTAGPAASPASPEPTSDGTAGVVEIASGITVIGDTAYSENGQWLAFSARPSDSQSGPDLYLWHVGDPAAVPVTKDHRTYFSAWLGDQVLASRLEIVEKPGESAAAATATATAATTDASPAASAEADGPPEARPTSFLIDPATLARTELAQPDVWLPVVDRSAHFVTYWSGTLRGTADNLTWQLGTGRLVLDRWSSGTAPEASPAAGASADPAASAPPIGPEGAAVPIVEGQTAAFATKFDPTGTRLAVWVAEEADATVGRLHLLILDADTGTIDATLAPLPGVPALRQFSMAAGRLAWVSPPGQDGQESSVQVLGWSHDNFGEIRTIPAKELFIVR